MVLTPPHHIFVELTGTHSSVFLHKPPSAVDVVNDLDSVIYSLYKVMLDPDALAAWLATYPYTNVQQPFAKINNWIAQHSVADDPIPQFKIPNIVYELGIPQLPNIYKHIVRLQLEFDTFSHLVTRYDTEDTFFYADFVGTRTHIRDKKNCFSSLIRSRSLFEYKDTWNPFYLGKGPSDNYTVYEHDEIFEIRRLLK